MQASEPSVTGELYILQGTLPFTHPCADLSLPFGTTCQLYCRGYPNHGPQESLCSSSSGDNESQDHDQSTRLSVDSTNANFNGQVKTPPSNLHHGRRGLNKFSSPPDGQDVEVRDDEKTTDTVEDPGKGEESGAFDNTPPMRAQENASAKPSLRPRLKQSEHHHDPFAGHDEATDGKKTTDTVEDPGKGEESGAFDNTPPMRTQENASAQPSPIPWSKQSPRQRDPFAGHDEVTDEEKKTGAYEELGKGEESGASDNTPPLCARAHACSHRQQVVPGSDTDTERMVPCTGQAEVTDEMTDEVMETEDELGKGGQGMRDEFEGQTTSKIQILGRPAMLPGMYKIIEQGQPWKCLLLPTLYIVMPREAPLGCENEAVVGGETEMGCDKAGGKQPKGNQQAIEVVIISEKEQAGPPPLLGTLLKGPLWTLMGSPLGRCWASPRALVGLPGALVGAALGPLLGQP